MGDLYEEFGLINTRFLTSQDTDIRRSIREGRLRQLTPEIYTDRGEYEALPPWEKFRVRAIAEGLAADRAVLVGRAAAAVWRLPLLDWNGPIELAYPNGRGGKSAQRSRGRVFRASKVSDAEIVHFKGVRVASLMRVFKDLGRYWGPEEAVIAIDAAWSERPQLTREGMQHELVVDQHYPGARAVRQAIMLADPRAESPQESRVRYGIVTSGVVARERITLQAEIRVNGRLYRVDMLIDEWLIIEIDGEIKYTGAFGQSADTTIRQERLRDNDLMNHAYRVLRFTARHTMEEIIATIAQALADGPPGRPR